ncbi:hypothetical protein JOQ06_011800, partial [Pogonophryne albipinna]
LITLLPRGHDIMVERDKMRRERLVPDVAAVQPRACGGHRKHTAALWVVHRRKSAVGDESAPERWPLSSREPSCRKACGGYNELGVYPGFPDLRPLTSSIKEVLHLSETPDSGPGPLLLAGYEDGSLLLWDVTQRAQLSQTKAHPEPVMCLTFDPQCLRGVSGSSEKDLCSWRLDGQNNLQ